MHSKTIVSLLAGLGAASVGFPAAASPTVMGLHANNPTNANIFSDTLNASLLYVAPPTIGDLQVVKQSFAVDPPTCEAAASVNKTRLSEVKTIEEIGNQILSLEQLSGGLITRLANKEISQSDFDQQYKMFSDLITAKTSDKLAAVASISPTPTVLLQSSGYYSVVAKANWDDAVAKVSGANPTLTVNHIPTADAEVFVSVLGVDGFTPNELIARVDTANIKDVASVVEGLQIDVEPTKVGACFMAFPQIMGSPADAYPFGVTINYTQQFALSTVVKAQYNLKDVYSYLEKTGKSGGLFSSKSWSEVTESHDVDELFKISITFETLPTPEEKETEQRRVREYLLGSAIADMTAKVVPPGNPGQTGAAIAAQTLVKTCGFNAYCAGAAAGLTILDGIFGKSGSSSSLTKVLDVKRTYDSTVTETIKVPGSISFALRQ
ncbi:hypothetical protein ACU8LZ_12520 [Rhizobium leguminosarum]